MSRSSASSQCVEFRNFPGSSPMASAVGYLTCLTQSFVLAFAYLTFQSKFPKASEHHIMVFFFERDGLNAAWAVFFVLKFSNFKSCTIPFMCAFPCWRQKRLVRCEALRMSVYSQYIDKTAQVGIYGCRASAGCIQGSLSSVLISSFCIPKPCDALLKNGFSTEVCACLAKTLRFSQWWSTGVSSQSKYVSEYKSELLNI